MLVTDISEKLVDSDPGHGHDHGHSHEGNEALRFALALLGGVLVLNSFLAKVLFSKVLDPFAIDLSAIIGALILAAPIFWSSIKDLLEGKVYMNELVALALIAAFARGDYRVAGAVAFFMLITITIEMRTAKGAEASIEALIRLTPRRARRLAADGTEEDVDVSELAVGDICRVRPGENFPADGTLITGTTSVNQASITGESLPADKAVGDDVYAGTQNLTGVVEIRVTRVGEDTTLGKVKDLIVQAERSRLPIMRLIDEYAGYYTPSVLMIAALVWFFTRDLNRVIAVLVMSCPCAIIISSPSALIAAIAAAARLGILIKDVNHLETAAKVKAVVFDKTGTLTEGVLVVARLHPAEGVELAELLETATAAESQSNHPAAQAMRKLAEEAGLKWEMPDEYEEVAGKGVVAKFGNDVLRVGRESWLQECGLDTRPLRESKPEETRAGMSTIFVARNDRVLGWIGLRDAVRPQAAETVKRLKELGILQCCMVTGDNESVARQVGARLGISTIRAGCLPQGKVEFVEELKKQDLLVAVVGDGVNDAPALAAGDIGIAMGAIGSDVAVQSASVALMNNDLRRVPFLIWVSRRARTVMIQNLSIAMGFIFGGLYFSTIGIVTPVIAAILHSAGTILILFNSARLVRAGEDLQASDAESEKPAGTVPSLAPENPPEPAMQPLS